MIKKEVIFNGNEKQFFATDDPDKVIIRYKDVTVAFNNVKRARFEGKGELANKISALLLDYLGKQGVRNHFIERTGDCEQLCRRIDIIPIEVIVRNRVAGSLATRLGIEEGFNLKGDIAEDHRQVEGLQSACAGRCLGPAALGVIGLGEDDVESTLGNVGILGGRPL